MINYFYSGLLSVGIALTSACAVSQANFSCPQHPEIKVKQRGFNVPSEALAEKISQSITLTCKLPRPSFSITSIETLLEKELELQTGRDLVVLPNQLDSLLDENTLFRTDQDLDLRLLELIYKEDEIKNVISDLNIPIIETKVHSLEITPYFILPFESKEIVTHELKRRYPTRLEEVTLYLDTQFSHAKEKKIKDLQEQISTNKKIALYVEGFVNPFMENYEYYRDELLRDKEELSRFFTSNNFYTIPVKLNKAYFTKILELLSEASPETQLLIFYVGHGTPQGIKIGYQDIITPQELKLDLEQFPGDATLILGSCYSGNIRDYFQREKAPTRVISASRNGFPVKTNLPGLPGHLVLDLIKSHLEFTPEHFKPEPSSDYYPSIYQPH